MYFAFDKNASSLRRIQSKEAVAEGFKSQAYIYNVEMNTKWI